jgi:hypothetical protein
MAVDTWIKLRTKLPNDGRLRVVSRICHASTVTALGALVTLWCLADAQADDNGVIYGYTAEDINDLVKLPGFCEALPAEWVDLSGEWVKLPEYQEHNGTTGKSRSQATKRQQKVRSVTDVANPSRTERDKSVTREEKRREDLKAPLSLSAGAGEGGLVVTDGEGKPQPPLDDAQAIGVGVPAAKRLRAIGIRVTALDPTLLALCAEKYTVEEIALLSAELALRKVHLFGDPDVHPELPELLASGATQQQMLLTNAQYTAIQAGAAEIGIAYIAKALRGRRQDAIDKQSPSRPSAKGSARKPSANDNFEGKIYVGTAINQLPPELRAGFERGAGDPA